MKPLGKSVLRLVDNVVSLSFFEPVHGCLLVSLFAEALHAVGGGRGGLEVILQKVVGVGADVHLRIEVRFQVK